MFYKEQIKELDKRIKKIVEEDYAYLLTIKGIGAVSIAGIVGEIGDVNNYHGSDSIVALAELCPLVYQSGNYDAKHTKNCKEWFILFKKCIVCSSSVNVYA